MGGFTDCISCMHDIPVEIMYGHKYFLGNWIDQGIISEIVITIVISRGNQTVGPDQHIPQSIGPVGTIDGVPFKVPVLFR